MVEIECVHRGRDLFGESPLWSDAEQALYWVDVKRRCIQRLQPATGEFRSWLLPDDVGSIGLRAVGGLIAATRKGLYALDIETGALTCVLPLSGEPPEVRFNDGKCDRVGRFWCGTLDDVGFAPVGSLFRFGLDHGCTKMADGFIVINGIAWSPDNRTMYVADSRRDVVYAYDFWIDDGVIENRRSFISTEAIPGRVDGATVASDGTYWCAHVRGGQVAQYDPSGRMIQAIALPVTYPLMCTFGGRDLDVLYVTTSCSMLGPADGEQPLAGSVLAIYGCGSRGIREPFYGG